MNIFFETLKPSDYIAILSSFSWAFFAFIFFIIGESILEDRRKIKDVIDELERIDEFMTDLLYFSEINIRETEDINRVVSPITILLNKFTILPLDNGLYRKLAEFRVRWTIVKFVIHLRVLNMDLVRMNEYITNLNEFSKIAIKDQLESKYLETMTHNFEQLKNNFQKLIENINKIKEDSDGIRAEIHFTLSLLKSPFIKRLYIKTRLMLSEKFRESEIQRILDSIKKV